PDTGPGRWPSELRKRAPGTVIVTYTGLFPLDLDKRPRRAVSGSGKQAAVLGVGDDEIGLVVGEMVPGAVFFCDLADSLVFALLSSRVYLIGIRHPPLEDDRRVVGERMGQERRGERRPGRVGPAEVGVVREVALVATPRGASRIGRERIRRWR